MFGLFFIVFFCVCLWSFMEHGDLGMDDIVIAAVVGIVVSGFL